jgi:soluble lytic murein transglycosylase-like protein
MKKLKVLVSCVCVGCFFLGSLPYEYRLELPCTPVRYKPEATKAAFIPARRAVPKAYRSLFDAAAGSAGIPVGVLESIAFVESGFEPAAMSPPRESGQRDLGMFQFNSTYLAWYADAYNAGIPFDPMEPAEAARVAARHLRFMYDYYDSWPTACLAYNAGMAAVDKEEIPDSSFRYLMKIYGDL